MSHASAQNPRFELHGSATAEDVQRPMARASIMNQERAHPWKVARRTAEDLARQGWVAVIESDFDNDASIDPADPNSTQYTVAIFRPQDHQAYAEFFAARSVELDGGATEDVSTATSPPTTVATAMGGACDYEVFRPGSPTGNYGAHTPLDQAPDRWGQPDLN